MLTLKEMSGRFAGVSWRGSNSFQAKCPCHDDKQASLTVSDGDNGIVLYCHSGCITENILQAIGLSFSDIMPDREKPVTKGRFDFQNIVATYEYRNGCRKLRDGSKNFLWQHKESDGSWNSGRGKAAHVLYQAGTPQQKVYVVEGEKDCNNLASVGLYCVSAEDGAGGKTKWHDSYTQELTGKDVVIIPDNDDVGRQFAEDIAARINPVTKSLKVVDIRKIWTELPKKGDVSDLIQHYGNDRAADLLRDLEQAAEVWTPFIVTGEDAFSNFNFFTIPDLTEEERKPPDFVIDQMLPVGMTFLSGAPKLRKSFMAIQLAIAVANGTEFFGHKTMKSDVVYLDLEGSKSRISARTQHLTSNIPRNLFITNTVTKHLADGLTDELRVLHRQHPEIRLVIIDTYSRSRGSYKSCGGNAYDDDVARLEPIQRMAIDENIALLFVHHDRKNAGVMTDSFERLSGTMGISGSADAVWNHIADGKRFEGKATLEFTPRDAKGGELKLAFDERYLEWMEIPENESSLEGNPVCSWIIENRPDRQREGQFYSYEDVFVKAYKTYSMNPADKVREQIEANRDALFSTCGIGVQLGVKSHGVRGIRIINLL